MTCDSEEVGLCYFNYFVAATIRRTLRTIIEHRQRPRALTQVSITRHGHPKLSLTTADAKAGLFAIVHSLRM